MVLSEQQRAFVGHDPAHHGRLFAGPGTGKSYTTVAYLERLAETHPELRAQMVTFTRAATAEFAKKMGDAALTGLGLNPPATVHSFALRLLLRMNASGLPMPLRIPDRWEAKELIRPHLSQRLKAMGHRRATPSVVEDLENEMAAGWESLDPGVILLADLDPQLRNAYLGAWQEHRLIFGHVLVSELPYRAGNALEDVGTEAVRLDLVLVDEYQDLNEADIRLLRLLSESMAIVAIGDDDQSIYGFRHAAPEGIRRFLGEFGGTTDYPLSESRRCAPTVLEAATTLIETAPDRPSRPRLRAMGEASAGRFAYLRFPSGPGEARGVARIIAQRVAQGVPPQDVAVLVRSQPRIWAGQLRPALEAHGMALASTDWVSDGLEDPALRRAVALARLAITGVDSLAWCTLVHLIRGVGPQFIHYVYAKVERGEVFGQTLLRLHEESYPDARQAAANKVAAVVRETLRVLQKLDTENAALDERRWGGWLIDQFEAAEFSPEGLRLLESVGAAVDPTEGLQGFLNQLEPLGRDLAANEAESVRLMSMTQSKGLTVNTAIVMGVEEGLIPFPKGDVNEERRLLYVAMTRATDMCLLTWAKRRQGQIARMGRPNVAARRRTSLLDNLEIGRWTDGDAFVQEFIEGGP